MSQDQKFQQIWEFRRRDDDVDSSSNGSKSSSGGEPVLKKHKFVSNVVLPQNDEARRSPISELKGQPDPGVSAITRHVGLENNVNATKKKTKRGSAKEGNKKKRHPPEPISLDDFKIFRDSLLGELKIARENMFGQMKEEMKKLLASRPRRKKVPKIGQAQQNSTALGKKGQKRTNNSNNLRKVSEDLVKRDQANGSITSIKKYKAESLTVCAKNSQYSSSHSDQIVSSSYLTLPSVLSEPRVEQQRIGSSPRNCDHTGMTGNDTNGTFERENLMLDASTHHGYFSGFHGESLGSFCQMGSQDMGCYGQHSTQTSSIGTGFSVPLHQKLDNCSNIPGQVVLENPLRDEDIFGLRMTGGTTRFSGASHTLLDQFPVNNLRDNMSYRSDGGPLAFGTRYLKDSNLYPN